MSWIKVLKKMVNGPFINQSVIVFGKIKMVNDPDKVQRNMYATLPLKFTNDQDYIDHELKYSGPSVQCFELIPDYISGKIIKES